MSDSIPKKITSTSELKVRYTAFRNNLRKLGEEKSEINTYVRFLREKEEWKLIQIANLLGTSIQTVYKITGGKS